MSGKIEKPIEIIINRYRLSTNSSPETVSTKYSPRQSKKKSLPVKVDQMAGMRRENACLVCRKHCLSSPAPYQVGTVVHDCNLGR